MEGRWWERWGRGLKLHGRNLLMVGRQLWTSVTKKTVGNTLYCNGVKSCCACKVPLLKKAHVQARLKFASEHLNDSVPSLGRECCGQMKPKLSYLASTQPAEFGGWKKNGMTQRAPFPQSGMEVETLRSRDLCEKAKGWLHHIEVPIDRAMHDKIWNENLLSSARTPKIWLWVDLLVWQ